MIRYFCDHCKKEIPKEIVDVNICGYLVENDISKYGTPSLYRVEKAHGPDEDGCVMYNNLVMCLDCRQKLSDHIEKFFSKTEGDST